ncbi:hypothetical protein [Actinoplanes sp. NPDC049802]|uniref:hypothetical protein n=1 Tax=Actinoplanes sp. NPDC049802 TaxID=3154742 RepID=UPI0033D5765C
MSYDEEPRFAPESSLYASATADTPQRAARRRKQVFAAIAGAAAVLTGAGFLATQLMNESQPTLPEPAALAPQTTPASAGVSAAGISPSDARTPGKSTKRAAPAERSPAPTPAAGGPGSPGADAARASAAIGDLRDRLGLGATGVAERTERLGDGTVRIVTARRDLTGDRELVLAGDDGTEVGDGVRCTTDVRRGTIISSEAPSPATLLCWRTSAERSVITMATAPDGEPSTADSVELIQREWERLG